jgi:phage gp36-like protein
MANEYAAAADVLTTLGTDILDDLAKDSDTVGATDHTLALIEQASRLIDGYVGSRYVVPLTAAAAVGIAKPHAVNMARWMLLERRFSGRYDTEGARWLYEQAISWAKDVRDRKADIPGATPVSESASTSAGTTSWTSNTVMYPVGYGRGF